MRSDELEITLQAAKGQLRAGRVAEAEQLYRRVLAQLPDCAEARHFLGLAELRRGNLIEAESLVRRSVELAPDAVEYHGRAGVGRARGRAGLALDA